ncbi:hypothetical protein [Aeromonas rivipollensis]|uniref:hypothetical protein n=1 Tax=Aeromonas rivipollensis TaxID=948519 RepID=UPI00259D866D|nr:hypothetical protein [Aeromonas rivipollensis]MDM5059504.1 hypothetical protein [Aeromonas rivipollensis]
MSANHVDYWAGLTGSKKSAMQEQLSDIATYNGFTQDSSVAAIAAAIMCDDMWIEYFSDIFERREFACIASQVVVRLLMEGDEDVNPHDEYLEQLEWKNIHFQFNATKDIVLPVIMDFFELDAEYQREKKKRLAFLIKWADKAGYCLDERMIEELDKASRLFLHESEFSAVAAIISWMWGNKEIPERDIILKIATYIVVYHERDGLPESLSFLLESHLRKSIYKLSISQQKELCSRVIAEIAHVMREFELMFFD